jgi:hypothetical protein
MAIMPIMSNERLVGRRFIWQRLDHIELVLVDLRRAIETMAVQTVVKQSEFEQIKYQVASFSEGMRELELRVIALEKRNNLEYWVLRQIWLILLVILAAYIVTRFL